MSSLNPQNTKEEVTKLWDVAGDDFSLDENRILEIANLSLDELELEVVFSMRMNKCKFKHYNLNMFIFC